MYAESLSSKYKHKGFCDAIYLSPHHFKRIFKEHTGRTPHRYLMEIRLEKAKELLLTGPFDCRERRFCNKNAAG
ncbi:MAG: helix-turn-helix domain-containing protein [Firmicutes bacterium]|nr:helix-turn-helix domain-containing protein [Bacillota bacterium]